ncbi:MAG TPA: HicB family protein [Lachnospiraceae bacterium]|jgi:predicted RNase H-like HicB family nuclease|uniref:type II toxin-antitoxin system HicB family antitoxin n=1 Tax=Muricomes intestini TaxID=1796634 RepID=UPI000E8077AD|nr:HicB family protein [Lachnospiraceae bacterium]HCR83972.1 HicB family protein [Lachnospiraceae bacterium]
MAKKGAYPIILKPADEGYYVRIPDFDIGTQGESVADAMEMARDVIGLMGIDMKDDGKAIPEPYTSEIVKEENDILTLVDIDFTEYRKKVDNKAVKKNCTIPYWMSVEADKEGINYSKVLQDAIAKILRGSKKSVN